ncbi:pentatricopeptide repeat-containing protein [Pyrus ussuriensis x Pyrus communis]|uniref:Pentatricopeptide repeat-containing protein n=1 Tax=Pyrus ussuriensis x Pyrus communis TaxID=2448454 RepID=A0A5N5FAK3_9ROSA|nr:pentatricopeptide repeat-containing protein [Pyrus ussuriensis x Pyrus communis]
MKTLLWNAQKPLCVRRRLLFNKTQFNQYKPSPLLFLTVTFEYQTNTNHHRYRHHLRLLRLTKPTPSTTTCRHYATKYTAKITSTSPTGLSVSAEVTPPSTQILLGRQSPSAMLSDPFSELSDCLTSLSLHITPSEASEILKSVTCPDLAVKFFRFCPSLSSNFHHDAFTCSRILLILSKSTSPARFDLVRSILRDMDRSSIHGNISTVNMLIGLFGSTEDLETCIGLVKKWNLNMNSYTYKCLLQAFLRSRDSGKALDTYIDMRRRGNKHDIFAYNMLLDALANDEKVEDARKVCDDMKKKHCEPDEFTYTIMIRMIGKLGKGDECLGLFQEMVNKGCAPNTMLYNTMIQALARSKMVDKAIIVFSKMVQNHCRPNEFTYSVVLNLLVAEGQLGRFDEVVGMSKKYMTKSIYAYLVRTLSKLGHAGEAHRLFCNMWSFHDMGDRDAYTSMLESLCSAGRTAEAVDLLNNIHEKGITTDTIMYNSFGSSWKIKLDGPEPDIFTYNIMISSFGRAGKVLEAVTIFEHLKNSDCKPDIISYNSLINCPGENGDVDEARMRFKEMQEKGFSPDVVTYSTLIECFGKTGRVEMACRLFNNMLAQGCYPNIVTYNILLDCLERCGRTAAAVDLYAKLKQQGLTPDWITYAVLERLQSGSHRRVRVRKQSPITGWVVSPLR